MSFPAEIRTAEDREALDWPVDHGGVEWEREDRRLAMERAAALRAASPVIETERIRPARRPQHAATRPIEWAFLVAAVLLVVGWAGFLAAILLTVTA